MALSGSNEPGHKQIYSRQLKELNLNYSADAFVQFYRSAATLKFLEFEVIRVIFIQDTQLHRSTKNSMEKGRTFTVPLIEIFLDLYENGNESHLQVISKIDP